MADFLSDMNALTQSVGNAANSITNLYNVRKDLETKRIASQVQAKQYDIMKRVNLPLGDPARISFSQDGGGTYFRDVLDQYDKETQELVGSSKWESVRGAVSSTLQPMTQDFSLKIADAYAAQEVEKAQVDFVVAAQNKYALADTLEKVAEIAARNNEMQKNVGIFRPADYETKVRPMEDTANARVIFNQAVSTPQKVARGVVDSFPDPSDPDPAHYEKPADEASARAVIAAAPVSAAAKQQANTALDGLVKSKTDAFKDVIKGNLTDRKIDGNVDQQAVSMALHDSGFVDRATVQAARTEFQGYLFGRNDIYLDTLVRDLSAMTPEDASREAVNQKRVLESFIADKSNSEYLNTSPGEKEVGDTMRKINAFIKDGDDGSDKDKTALLEFAGYRGDFIKIAAESESTGIGNDKGRLEKMVGVLAKTERRMKELLAEGVDPGVLASAYNGVLGEYNAQYQKVSDNMKQQIGATDEKADTYRRALETVVSKLSPKQQDYYHKQIMLPVKDRDPNFTLAKDGFDRVVSTMLTNMDQMSPAEQRETGLALSLTVADFTNEIFKNKIDERAKDRVGKPPEDEIARLFTGIDSGKYTASIYDTRSGTNVGLPYLANLTEQGMKMGVEALSSKLGIEPGLITQKIDPKNGDIELDANVTSQYGNSKTVSKRTFSLNGVTDKGKNRLVLVDNKSGEKIYIDGGVDAVIKSNQDFEMDKTVRDAAEKGYNLVDKYRGR